MEFTFRDGKIEFPNKELTILDKLVLKFIKTIDFRYVIVSGYVAILFGRSRNTEDIDLLIERVTLRQLKSLFENLPRIDFYCLNAENAEDAYSILDEGSSVRFAENSTVEPNFELKFTKRDTDFYSLDNSITVVLSDRNKIKISPIELQIAYKLFLGSEKDYADARHMYKTFGKNLNKRLLKEFLNKLGIKSAVVKFALGEKLD